MAKANQKIDLNVARNIPFNKLVLSQSNVRHIKAGLSIEDLAEDIARHGLIQSLKVRPFIDAGKKTDLFEVPAGGRRYRAIGLLVKQKRLAKTAPVPCIVRVGKSDIPAEEDSLAENIQRVALHPLDQFRAFQTLREKGLGEEDIAARFFVSVNVVRQRLRLASVSPKLLDVYAEDGMTLDQLMAFTVSGDHARQEQVWEAVQQSYTRDPYHIRHLLTENTVRLSDKRVQFVGLEAYEAAGGAVMRDLFQQDHASWLEDVPLLEKLANDKLKAEAEKVIEEGWKWVRGSVDFPYGHTHGLRKLKGSAAAISAEEEAAIDALHVEYDRLSSEYEEADELPDEIDERMGELEAAIATFEDRPVSYDPSDMERAGVFISITSNGGLLIERGFVRPEDEAPADTLAGETTTESPTASRTNGSAQPSTIIMGPEPESDAGGEDNHAVRPLPDRLITELTAYRTLALRNAVANHPHVALTVLLHKLCLNTFHLSGRAGCLEVAMGQVQFPVQAPDLKECSAARAVAERHETWRSRLPRDEAALWGWLDALDEASRQALLAHCLSFSINALYEKADRTGAGPSAHGITQRLIQADRLARAVNLDLVQAGWRPTVDNYLGRVTKPRILEAVREAKGEQAAQLIDHLKKNEMAKEAERLLERTGWLPEPLRLSEAEVVSDEEADEADVLPEFLTGEDDEVAAESKDEQPHVIAAE